MKWITVREAALRTSLSQQAVRTHFKLQKFGHAVRVWEGDIVKVTNKRVLAVIEGDPGLKAIVQDFRNAEAVIEHLIPASDAVADLEMAALLTSTLAACRLEHPDWPPIGVEAVFPPTLAFIKANLPPGGGARGDALRALILAG